MLVHPNFNRCHSEALAPLYPQQTDCCDGRRGSDLGTVDHLRHDCCEKREAIKPCSLCAGSVASCAGSAQQKVIALRGGLIRRLRLRARVISAVTGLFPQAIRRAPPRATLRPRHAPTFVTTVPRASADWTTALLNHVIEPSASTGTMSAISAFFATPEMLFEPSCWGIAALRTFIQGSA